MFNYITKFFDASDNYFWGMLNNKGLNFFQPTIFRRLRDIPFSICDALQKEYDYVD